MEHGAVDVGGCAVAWCAQGDRSEDAVVLVHGARAHRHWWDAVVAGGLGAGGRRVVAFDLSGHGESGRRSDYSAEAWADEVARVIEVCAGGRAAVIGHSMGGLVSLVAAARHPDLVSGLVLVDTRIRISEPPEALVPRGTPAKVLRTFLSREAAVESIRLFPPQPVVNAEVVKHVAERSIGCVEGEWTWKFDPGIAQRFNDALINRYLAEVDCPVAMVYGELSALVDESSPRAAETILGHPVPTTVVTGTHHHLILDRPEACAGAISGALAAASFNPPPD